MSDGIMGVLQFAVDGVSLQQQTTANNIANDEPPTFPRRTSASSRACRTPWTHPGGAHGADRREQLDPGRQHERQQRRPADRDDAGHPGDHAVPEPGRAAERAVPAGAGRRRRELLMSLFGALPIATSGIDAAQEWIDAIGGNIANARRHRADEPGCLPDAVCRRRAAAFGPSRRGRSGRGDRDRARQQRGHGGIRPGQPARRTPRA